MKLKLHSLSSILITALFIGLLISCAHPVSPIGGDKDIIPPKIVQSEPANFSPNFKGKTISIEFDEFVKLDKLQQQLLISPPTDQVPDIRLRGKTLIIKFQEELKPETTYSVFFGDAIVDLSESNPVKSFSFVFSTGSVVDSMSFTGKVFNAFDLKPVADTYVMLYLDDNDTIPTDSLPYQIRPYYLSRTNKEGYFELRNLRNEAFKMFALTDMNSNFLFDMPGEAIAFVDSMLWPEYVKPAVIDTTSDADSTLRLPLRPEADSLLQMAQKLTEQLPADSVNKLSKKSRLLYLFNEVDSTQKLLRADLSKPGLLVFAFRYPAADIKVESLFPLPDTFQILKKYSKMSDTLFWYFSQKSLDSLHLTITRDSSINDTLHLSLVPRSKPGDKRSVTKKAKASNGLQLVPNVRGRKLDLNKSLMLRFEEPVVRVQLRPDNRLISNKDTLINQVNFTRYDSIGLQYRLESTFEAGGNYDLMLPDSVFFGFSGLTNDTIRINFKVPTMEEYGNLILKMNLDPDEVVIVQLLGAKEIVLSEQSLSASGTLRFDLLTPGKYKLKAIHDRNRNGRWDTGKYLKKIQPEAVLYFSKELEIRANWDVEEDWNLSGKF